MAQISTNFSALKSQISNFHITNQQIKQKLSSILQTRTKINTQVHNLSKQYDKKIKQLQNKLEEAISKNDTLDKQNKLYRKDIQGLEARLLEKERLISMLIFEKADVNMRKQVSHSVRDVGDKQKTKNNPQNILSKNLVQSTRSATIKVDLQKDKSSKNQYQNENYLQTKKPSEVDKKQQNKIKQKEGRFDKNQSNFQQKINSNEEQVNNKDQILINKSFNNQENKQGIGKNIGLVAPPPPPKKRTNQPPAPKSKPPVQKNDQVIQKPQKKQKQQKVSSLNASKLENQQKLEHSQQFFNNLGQNNQGEVRQIKKAKIPPPPKQNVSQKKVSNSPAHPPANQSRKKLVNTPQQRFLQDENEQINRQQQQTLEKDKQVQFNAKFVENQQRHGENQIVHNEQHNINANQEKTEKKANKVQQFTQNSQNFFSTINQNQFINQQSPQAIPTQKQRIPAAPVAPSVGRIKNPSVPVKPAPKIKPKAAPKKAAQTNFYEQNIQDQNKNQEQDKNQHNPFANDNQSFNPFDQPQNTQQEIGSSQDFFTSLGANSAVHHEEPSSFTHHRESPNQNRKSSPVMQAQESSIDYADNNSIISATAANMLDSQFLPEQGNQSQAIQLKKMTKKKPNKRKVQDLDPSSFF